MEEEPLEGGALQETQMPYRSVGSMEGWGDRNRIEDGTTPG